MKPIKTEIARRKILGMSKALSTCTEQASLYAKCVAARASIKQHECDKEFQTLAQCMKQAARKT